MDDIGYIDRKGYVDNNGTAHYIGYFDNIRHVDNNGHFQIMRHVDNNGHVDNILCVDNSTQVGNFGLVDIIGYVNSIKHSINMGYVDRKVMSTLSDVSTISDLSDSWMSEIRYWRRQVSSFRLPYYDGPLTVCITRFKIQEFYWCNNDRNMFNQYIYKQ